MEETIFIGREEEIRTLGKFFVKRPKVGYGCAVVGPNGIGKNYLVKHLREEQKRYLAENKIGNVFYFQVQIHSDDKEPEKFIWNFWHGVMMKMIREITPLKLEKVPYEGEEESRKYQIKELENLYAYFQNGSNADEPDSDITLNVTTVFELYTALGIHVHLVIDEFDRMVNRQVNSLFYENLFELSPVKSMNDYKLSIMLIARRQIKTIKHQLNSDSNFEDAFPAVTLRGFLDKELDQYFETYKELPCGMPTKEEQRGILYFCGRHPGLLMKMREALKDKYTSRVNELEIADVFVDKNLGSVYSHMVNLMREEYVDDERTMDCTDTFVQTYIGPVYDAHISEHISGVFQRGFVTKIQSDGKSLFELVGMEDNDRYVYEPLAPYFVEYFKNRVLPGMTNHIGALLNHTELEVRQVILRVMKERFPTSYERELESFARSKDGYLESLRNTALRNDAAERNISYTKLDVMAFHDYANIIKRHWADMREYFPSYSNVSALETDFISLRDGRNCYAHNNSNILNVPSLKKLQGICEKVCRDIAGETQGEEVSVSETPEASAQTAAGAESLLNQKVIFCCRRQAVNGNYQGIIKGTEYQATLGKQSSAKFTDAVGTEMEVTVVQWNSGQNRFRVEV